MGSRASMRDDDIARAEFVVDSARQAVGELMRKIEQVCSGLLTPVIGQRVAKRSNLIVVVI